MHSDATTVEDDSDISSVLPNDIDIPDQSMFDGVADEDAGRADDYDDSGPADRDVANDETVDVNEPARAAIAHEPAPSPQPQPETPSAPLNPVSAYLGILSDAERAAIAQRAYLRGPAPDDPDWLIAYAMLRAVDQLDTAMAVATKRVATMLTEPREYVVHAEGGGGKLEDLADIRRHLSSIDERLAAFPYKSSTTVERLTEPFANLAEASASLVLAIDKSRASASAAINDASKTARERMIRTAFEGHALPARAAVTQFWITTGLLLAILIAIVVVGVHLLPRGIA